MKCETYWPENIRSIKVYGDIKVTLLSANPNPDFIIRKFRLESVNCTYFFSNKI